MNTTPLEDQVHDALHRTADPLQRSPLTVGDVRQRARRIQRRRAVVAGAAVAAALAVAVPVGIALNGPTLRSETPPATQSRVPTVTGPVLVDPRSAPVGDPPAGTLVDVAARTLTAGGETVDIPVAYDQIAAYRGGWIAMLNDEGVRTVQVLDDDFGVVEQVSNTSRLTVAADGSRVAYAFHDGIRWIVVENILAGEQGERTTPLPDGPLEATVRTVGFLPNGELVAAQIDPDDASETTFVITAEGTIEPIEGFSNAVSSSPMDGMVAGFTRSGLDTSCSQVVDGRARTGAAVWETCDYSLGAFSPDGQHLVGFAAYLDGVSPTLTILDATTGEVALDLELVALRNRVVGIASEVVWEDDDSLVATLVQGNQQYVVRLGLDGTVERVAGPVTNDDGTVSLRLTAGLAGQ